MFPPRQRRRLLATDAAGTFDSRPAIVEATWRLSGSNPRRRDELLAIGRPPATGRRTNGLARCLTPQQRVVATFELRAAGRVNDVRSNCWRALLAVGLRCPPRGRAIALRPSDVLLLVGVTLWSTPVACLWTNESWLVLQARRSRYPRPVPGKGLIELRTADGIRLDALSLTHDSASAYGRRRGDTGG